MRSFRFPKIPYDEVQSECIRGEIRSGDIEDVEHREYVNKLIRIEWYSTGGRSQVGGGIARCATLANHYRLAAEYPEEFDIVQREVGGETRADWSSVSRSEPDISEEEREEMRKTARRHGRQWQRVQESTERDRWVLGRVGGDESRVTHVPRRDRRSLPVRQQ